MTARLTVMDNRRWIAPATVVSSGTVNRSVHRQYPRRRIYPPPSSRLTVNPRTPSSTLTAYAPAPSVLPSRESPRRGDEWISPRRGRVGPVGANCIAPSHLFSAWTIGIQLDPTRPFFSMSNCKNMPRTNWRFPALSNAWIPDFSRAQLRASSNPRSTCVRLPLSSPAWRDGVGPLCASSPTPPFVRSFVR